MSQIEEFTQTGDFTTEYLDAPTGQLYVSYEFPNAALGIIYRLEVGFEREPPPATPEGVDPVAPLGAVGIIEDSPDTGPAQGQTKLEDVPSRYLLKFSPSDPAQEYVATVYECDPPAASPPIQSPRLVSLLRPVRAPRHHPLRRHVPPSNPLQIHHQTQAPCLTREDQRPVRWPLCQTVAACESFLTSETELATQPKIMSLAPEKTPDRRAESGTQ